MKKEKLKNALIAQIVLFIVSILLIVTRLSGGFFSVLIYGILAICTLVNSIKLYLNLKKLEKEQ